MAESTERVIALLESIDRSLKQLLARQQGSAPQAVASDRDLDSKWGDPELKFNPRDWTGASFKGRKFSECPPELLDRVAETFDYFARKAEEKNERTDKGKPVADYKRADAARARGWAKRMRDGTHRKPETTPTSNAWSDEEGAGELTADGVRW